MLSRKVAGLVVVAVTIIIVYSCKKSFLQSTPQGTLDEPTLTDIKGLNNLLVGAYALLDNYDQAIEFNQFGASASNSLFGDIGDRFINPYSHPRTWSITILIGILLNMMYWTFKFIRQNRPE